MKKIFLATLCGSTFLIVSGQTGTKLITIFDNKLSISIPSDVDTMSAENVKLKYHKTADGKTYYYSNKDLDFSMVISLVRDEGSLKEDDMVKHKDELIRPVVAKGYKLEEGVVKKVNGHSFIVVSFYSDVPGGKVFNRRFYAIVGGKLVLVSFNAYGEDSEKRKLQIEQSINSVVIQ